MTIEEQIAALEAEIGGLDSQYGDPKIYNSDPNANLREALISGNENAQSRIGNFSNTANLLTDRVNNQQNNATNRYNNALSGLSSSTNAMNDNATNNYFNNSSALIDNYNTTTDSIANSNIDNTRNILDNYQRNTISQNAGMNRQSIGALNSYSNGMNGLVDNTNNAMNRYISDFSNEGRGIVDGANERTQGIMDKFNNMIEGSSSGAKGDLSSAASDYTNRARGIADGFGTADKDTLGRYRGQYYAGVDSGYDNASNELQSSLAARGLSGSGIFARGLNDLNNSRAGAMSSAGVSAYNDAIDRSDSVRGQQLANEGNIFGANRDSIMGGFDMGMSGASAAYSNSLNGANQMFDRSMGMASSDFNNNTNNVMNQYNRGASLQSDNFNNTMNYLNSSYGRSMDRINTKRQDDLNAESNRVSNLSGANLNRFETGSGLQNTMLNQTLANNQNRYNMYDSANTRAFNSTSANNNDAYTRSMGVKGQNLQNSLNYDQQRIANLTGYAQLGRGMSGMSQNYLGQAGSSYGNIANTAGQTAGNLGQLDNSYNQAMWDANANSASGKGSMLGTIGGSAITAFSDKRLKSNINKVGEINGYNIYTWDWNEEGTKLAGDQSTFGVLAQEVMEISPLSVIEHESGYYQVDYSKIFQGVA